MKRVLSLVFALVLIGVCLPARAQDDQYVRIYGLIQEGDAAYNSRQYVSAMGKYREALQQLQSFQRSYPEWNSNIVKYRLSFLEAIISEITLRHATALVPADAAATNAAPKPAVLPAEVESQIAALKSQLQQLQTDNATLEAKLKEALRVQPAAADPRALERAESEIRNLQKENALLKVSLAEPRPAADPKELEQLKKQLAEANQKATENADRVTALTVEKADLEKKLQSAAADPSSPAIAGLQKELESTRKQLLEQSDAASRLALERSALQERTKALALEADALAALRAEHEIVKKQLAEARAAQPESDRLAQELSAAKAHVAVLTTDQNVLKLENAALEQRLKTAQTAAKAVTNVIAQSDPAEAVRIQQLERERDELRNQLEAAQKELASLRTRGGANAKVEELQNEIQVLRTRLAVIETQKIPYTEEEEALIKKAEAEVVAGKSGRVSSRNLPAGAMTLVNEAQREFAARRFDKAEEKYQEVLKLDDKNVYTRANLAAIQMELQRYDEAERNLDLALSNAPDDSFSLSLMGLLRFRQNRLDDSLDALGRAAKLDPQNAEIQNYLGLTLSQKGLRKAAEQALRKAIMLDPNYASAHYNLAVIYLAQQPPQLELARVHYRKAVAAGITPSPDMERMLNGGTQTP